MTSKYQRPAGAFAGSSGLANRTKYQDDASATPKRAVSSAKIDGDLNYMIDALNQMDEASGTRASITERMDVSLNADGTLKLSVAGAMDEWVVHVNAGAMTRVDNSTFTMAGDWRGIYTLNRRVKVTVAGVGLVGDVSGVSYAGGITTITMVDLLDGSGFIGLISSVPTSVAYGPLTGGNRGNTPRRFDGFKIPAGAVTYEFKGSGTDMLITRDSLTVAAVTAGGLAGYAPTSVGAAALSDDVFQMLVPTGAVMPFAGSATPTGWLLCAGQAVSRSTYASLYVLLGTVYGTGNGTTTFNLPDLRGRAVIGLDNMNGTDAGRLSVANTLGGSGGAQMKSATTDGTALTIAQMPSHGHTFNSQGQTGAGGGGYSLSATDNSGGTALGGFGNNAINVNGGGAAHTHGITNLDVLPPYMLLNHIIKT